MKFIFIFSSYYNSVKGTKALLRKWQTLGSQTDQGNFTVNFEGNYNLRVGVRVNKKPPSRRKIQPENPTSPRLARGARPAPIRPPKNVPRANGALKWLSGYRPRGLAEDCRTRPTKPDQYQRGIRERRGVKTRKPQLHNKH